MSGVVVTQIRDRLVATPAVTAFVGTSPSRIYPHTRGGNPTPAITYFAVDDTPLLSMGYAKQFGPVRIQISCWSALYLEAKEMAAAVRNSLRGYTNPAGSPPIDRVIVESEGPDLYEPDTLKYHVPVDIIVWTTEP